MMITTKIKKNINDAKNDDINDKSNWTLKRNELKSIIIRIIIITVIIIIIIIMIIIITTIRWRDKQYQEW